MKRDRLCISFWTLSLLVASFTISPCHVSPSLESILLLSRSCCPITAVRRDRPADGRPGGHGGPLHPAPGRGAEGGATGRPHCGRLRPGEQDGESLLGHPQGHRLHRLPLHPLREGWMNVFLCSKGVRKMGIQVGEVKRWFMLTIALCAYKTCWCLHENSWPLKREWF